MNEPINTLTNEDVASRSNGTHSTVMASRDETPTGASSCVGQVGAPARQEATSVSYSFWVPRGMLVEATQLVTCESVIAGAPYKFYGIVDEVHRQSRKRDMGGEVDESDGDPEYVPPFESEGYTYASVSILNTEPFVLTPPRERSKVFLAQPGDARKAYGANEIERPLEIGLIKNGGDSVIEPGVIDLDYLLGANGGHMNVTGVSGRGTKSSFLLFVTWMLLRRARRQAKELPSDPNRLRIVPIIFNVKGLDLFHIDRASTRYRAEKHGGTWQALDVDQPEPFSKVTFFAAQQPGSDISVHTGRGTDVEPYSWSLGDLIEHGLFLYLFAETDANDPNFSVLAQDIESWLTDEQVGKDGSISRTLRQGQPVTTLKALLEWVDEQAAKKDEKRALHNHHNATWKKFHRRLLKMLYESSGVLRRDDQKGKPLNLVRADTSDPIVVDLAALAGQAEMQRFVVATILRQLIEARTAAQSQQRPVYLVILDELNRFAPRGARDSITQLVEKVAAEMRSQGIILLGAQQQASKVSEKVIESSGILVLGKAGALELASSTWRMLSDAARRKAANLSLDEKLIIQDNFREPMHVRVPFPAWAMNPQEAAPSKQGGPDLSGLTDE